MKKLQEIIWENENFQGLEIILEVSNKIIILIFNIFNIFN